MSLALKKPVPAAVSPHAVPNPEESARDTSDTEEIDHDDGLLAIAGPIMVACYVLFFIVAFVTFFGTGTALFAVGVGIAFTAVYFAIPLLFLRMRSKRDARWIKDDQAKSPLVDVCTGQMKRWEAVLQIATIPLAILIGFSLLAIRWGTL